MEELSELPVEVRKGRTGSPRNGPMVTLESDLGFFVRDRGRGLVEFRDRGNPGRVLRIAIDAVSMLAHTQLDLEISVLI